MGGSETFAIAIGGRETLVSVIGRVRNMDTFYNFRIHVKLRGALCIFWYVSKLLVLDTCIYFVGFGYNGFVPAPPYGQVSRGPSQGKSGHRRSSVAL